MDKEILENRLQEMDDQFCKQSQHGEEKLTKFFSLNELNDRKEFVGQLIDIFEDFLEKRHVVLDNPEKFEDEELEDAAIIFGSDFDELADRIEDTLQNWGVFTIPLKSTQEEEE